MNTQTQAISMSSLVFGTGGRFGRLSEPLAKKLIDFAIDSGVRTFDTGFEYSKGNSQALLFRSLAKYLDTNSLEIKLSTKFRTPSEPGLLLRSIDQTLSSLPHRDYIDTVFLWGPTPEEIKDSLVWDELEHLRSSGKILRYGVNTHDIRVMNHLRSRQHDLKLDDIMVDYNLLQLNRKSLIDSFSAAGVRVWAGTALCQGFLNQSLTSMILRTRSASYLGRALLNPPTRRFLASARSLRKFIKSSYPEYFERIPLSFVISDTSISYVPIGMLSCSSINKNLNTLNSPVPSSILKSVSEWARENCQVRE